MSETVIRAAGLAKRFGTVSAVGGIDFEVRRGTVLGLLGGNGAGKTTTIAMLLGLILPSAGEARVLDCDPARDRRRLLPRVNFSSPYVELPKRLSVAENLSVFARLYGVEDVRGRIARLADELELGSLLKPPDRDPVLWREDPRVARQGARQRARGVVPRRADRVP